MTLSVRIESAIAPVLILGLAWRCHSRSDVRNGAGVGVECLSSVNHARQGFDAMTNELNHSFVKSLSCMYG